ncbi:MAG: glutathione S-transferase, partial [Alphaproteobacteria bacterium]|nr:glutathione S-transferase [Alphaproteobacteria bacterium]
CAEMHSGFADLRRNCPMDMIAHVAAHQITDETRAQIQRITEIWTNCRNEYGAGGDFLFGRFGLADCFYAPVVSRFQTYDIALQGRAKAYTDAILARNDLKEWIADAAQEEARRA